MSFVREKIIIGNWKMFKNATSASADFLQLANLLASQKLKLEVGIAAPHLFLADLALKTQNSVTLLAQNAHWAKDGAFTGEVSTEMLKSVGVAGSLIGHSERRQMFGETNHTAGLRIGALLRAGLKAVLCIGETLQERESGQLQNILEKQLTEAFAAAAITDAPELFDRSHNVQPLFSIAYEPVWAIGTGKAATSVEAQEAHAIIRNVMAKIFNHNTAEKIRILYGGSVKLSNVQEFINCKDIDGALVGGASLNSQEFFEMCVKSCQ